MNIKTKDLRAFARAAGSIRTGSVIPVHAFILLSHGVMTKTNDNQFVSYQSEFDGECLVDEKVLFNFVQHTKAESIEITAKGKSVTLSDGTRQVKAPTDDVLNFQQPIKSEGAPFPLTRDVIDAIGTAGQFINEEGEMLPVKCHVFVGNKTVAGTNGNIGYQTTFADDLPEIVLTKGEADLIGKMIDCLFSQNDTWHFYQDGPISYGWIKSTAQYIDLDKIFNKASHDVELPRAPLLSFCELAVASSVGKSVVGSFTGSGGMLQLLVQDREYDIDISQEVEYGGTDIAQFGFGPSLFLRLLKNFPADTYVFSKGQSLYYLTSGNTICLIMEMK